MLHEMANALLLTLLTEGAAAFILGYRRRREQLALAGINILTNLPFNLFLWICVFCGVRVDLGLILPLEILIVLVEWRLLVRSLAPRREGLLRLAFLLNLASAASGMVFLG
jgi:hypothetical protein